eukprot:TRINITY_DN38362_c0_g1_i1.p1 TRINITY_DN38362_c0_g1~~TRINITY_DN38362_c0_g1_i1.p1  ORF type:complete len:135 (-),score=18.68 TRINITY_DN38362_c0_g1_i1:302-679(-)
MQDHGNNCSGKAKCDKKCSGTGKIEIGIFSFNLKVKKRKASILKCRAKVEPNPGTDCSLSDQTPWLGALCHTLNNQGCTGRCTGNPHRLDCSCLCHPEDGDTSCAKYRCDAGGWLCTEQCQNKGK